MRAFQPFLIFACLAVVVSGKIGFRHQIRDAGTQLTPPSSEGEVSINVKKGKKGMLTYL